MDGQDEPLNLELEIRNPKLYEPNSKNQEEETDSLEFGSWNLGFSPADCTALFRWP